MAFYLSARPGDQVKLKVTPAPQIAFLVATLDDRSLPQTSNPIAQWPSGVLVQGVTFQATKLTGYDIHIFANVPAGQPPAPVTLVADVAGVNQLNYAPKFGGAITWEEIKVFVNHV